MPAVGAQEVQEISVATRLRKEPSGIPLVSLPAGTTVESGRTRGDWREVVIEGWIFSGSTEKTTRDGFDLVVTTAAGENIREAPNGAVVGRVRSGTLFHKEEVRGGWTRVRRAGWVPRHAVRAGAAREPAGACSGGGAPGGPGPADGAGRVWGPADPERRRSR